MALAYTKEFLVNAFISRYSKGALTQEQLLSLMTMADKFYDEVGKDKFRTYCSLDTEAIKKYKLESVH